MDFHNLQKLQQMAKKVPNCKAKIELLGSYLNRAEDEEGLRDPYYVGYLFYNCFLDLKVETLFLKI